MKRKIILIFTFGIAMACATAASSATKREGLEKEYASNSMRAVPRDAFPVLNDPTMGTIAEGDKFLRPNEWVIGVTIGGDSRAYPITVMGFHELINDTVGDRPITVCW